MNIAIPASSFLIACGSGLLLTPLVRAWALRVDLVDHPDAHRKVHRKSTALGGGIAILLATLAGSLSLLFADANSLRDFSAHADHLAGIAAGVVFIAAVGLWDDAYRLRARYKLVGQIIASSLIVAAGLSFDQVSFAGQIIDLGWLSIPITIFWLVACTNALNLIDGSDGLASTIGIVLCSTIAATAITLQNDVTAVVSLALAGALVAFLRYNAPPATIFAGDTGSMSIGMLAGALSIQSNTKGAAAYALMVPLAIWVIPLMDVGMAVLRRKLTGRSLSAVDRSHLHHCLLERGFGPRQLLLFVGGLCAFCGLGAWLSVRFSNSWFGLLSSIGVISFLVLKGLFGHAEIRLASQHFANLGRRIWRTDGKAKRGVWQSQVRIQGVLPWQNLWEFLVAAADELGLIQLTLDLNLPWLHEGYHASWMQASSNKSEHPVRLTWPLACGGRTIGTLTIVGESGEDQLNWLDKISAFLEEVQDRLPNVETTESPPFTAASETDARRVSVEKSVSLPASENS
jgi:UDP-GlcNAc:undecaprenyl-phosphate GlcNAc-1-phosphate transferase